MARIINTDAADDGSKKYINECTWISEIGTLIKLEYFCSLHIAKNK